MLYSAASPGTTWWRRQNALASEITAPELPAVSLVLCRRPTLGCAGKFLWPPVLEPKELIEDRLDVGEGGQLDTAEVALESGLPKSFQESIDGRGLDPRLTFGLLEAGNSSLVGIRELPQDALHAAQRPASVPRQPPGYGIPRPATSGWRKSGAIA